MAPSPTTHFLLRKLAVLLFMLHLTRFDQMPYACTRVLPYQCGPQTLAIIGGELSDHISIVTTWEEAFSLFSAVCQHPKKPLSSKMKIHF